MASDDRDEFRVPESGRIASLLSQFPLPIGENDEEQVAPSTVTSPTIKPPVASENAAPPAAEPPPADLAELSVASFLEQVEWTRSPDASAELVQPASAVDSTSVVSQQPVDVAVLSVGAFLAGVNWRNAPPTPEVVARMSVGEVMAQFVWE